MVTIVLPPPVALLKKHSMQFSTAGALVFCGCRNTSRCLTVLHLTAICVPSCYRAESTSVTFNSFLWFSISNPK